MASGPVPTAKPVPAKAQPNAALPSETNIDLGCRGLPSDRSSALCAEWTAVDVSRDALRLSEASYWLSIVGAGLGFLTTVAALFAVVYAKKAFQSSEIDLRPWMQFGVENSWATGHQSGCTAAFKVTATNIGRTPAIDVSCIVESFRWNESVIKDRIIPFFNNELFAADRTQLVSLLPGETYVFNIESIVDDTIGTGGFTIGVKLGYRWPKGQRARSCRAYHTDYCWDDPKINPHSGDVAWPASEQRLYAAPVNVTS